MKDMITQEIRLLASDTRTKGLHIMPEAVERRKQQHPETEYLSDWQIHSAHITAGAITLLACGFQTGPLYIPMPTGSGKTIGAIWGIVDFVRQYPEQRLCFLTPYKESVDAVYKNLLEYLTADQVGYYYSGTGISKAEELSKQVIILTHQFVSHNEGLLDDRDVFVVDEAIYETGKATLKLSEIAKAKEWATANDTMVSEFTQLLDFSYNMEKAISESDKLYLAAPTTADLSWAKVIACDLDLVTHSQKMSDPSLLSDVKKFCKALVKGMVFITKGTTIKGGYDPVFSAALLSIPRMDKTVVLSATGGLLYSIAGAFEQDTGSTHYWSPPSYENLKLVQLSGPTPKGGYKYWNTDNIKASVVAYVDWLVQAVPEKNLYITLPKKVIDNCLTGSFGIPTTSYLTLPIELQIHGKTVHLSHHAISVGSNKFKDCDAVIYLWDNHIPSSVAVQRLHTLSDQPITDEDLEGANSKPLGGDYKRIRDAQYIDNTMQHIGRGNVRNINGKAEVGAMTAYILTTSSNRFPRIAAQYGDCQLCELTYETPIEYPTGRIEKVLFYLKKRQEQGDVPAKEVEKALGFELRRYRHELEDSWDLSALGYRFQAGTIGRGNGALFKWRLGEE